jgi:hypothetical protein
MKDYSLARVLLLVALTLWVVHGQVTDGTDSITVGNEPKQSLASTSDSSQGKASTAFDDLMATVKKELAKVEAAGSLAIPVAKDPTDSSPAKSSADASDSEAKQSDGTDEKKPDVTETTILEPTKDPIAEEIVIKSDSLPTASPNTTSTTPAKSAESTPDNSSAPKKDEVITKEDDPNDDEAAKKALSGEVQTSKNTAKEDDSVVVVNDDVLTLDDKGNVKVESNKTEPAKPKKSDKEEAADDEDTLLTNEDAYLYVYGKDGKRYSVSVKKTATTPMEVPKSGIIEPENTYSLPLAPVTYTISEDLWDDEFHAIEMEGVGKLKVELLYSDAPNAAVVRTIIITLELNDVRNFMIIQGEKAFQSKRQTLRLTSMDIRSNLDFIALTIHRTKSLDLPFNLVTQFHTHMAKEIRTKVFSEKPKKGYLSRDRFQFLMETSLLQQKLSGKEAASMRINYSKRSFPTLENYDLKPSANTGFGLLKSISKDKPGFCDETTGPCEYYVTIFVADIDQCTFSPTVIRNGDKISFEDSMMWLEEVETGESVEYIFVPEKINNRSMFLAFTPIDNFSECLVNIGSRPTRKEDYQFVLGNGKREDIMITSDEISGFNYPNSNIYVKFIGMPEGLPATLTFKAGIAGPSDCIELKPNSLVRGIAVKEEVLSYFISFGAEASEPSDIGFIGRFRGGSGKLLIKECNETEPDCKITKEDIDDYRSVAAGNGKKSTRLRVSAPQKRKTEWSLETLFLSFQCAGKTDADAQAYLSDDYPISKTCNFAVAVFIMDGDKAKPIDYQLEVTGGSNHVKLSNRKAKAIKALPDTTSYFSFPLNATAATDQNVDIKVFGLSGMGNMYVSQGNAYPSADNYEHKISYSHDTSSYLATKTYELNFTVPVDTIRASNQIYIAFEAESYSIFDLFVSTRGVPGESLGELMTPGETLHRSIGSKLTFHDYKERAVAYRNFHLDCRKGKSAADIKSLEIVLNSDTFSLLLCVYPLTEGANTKVNLKNPCRFSSRIDYLKLTEKDLKENPNGQYLVSVQKVLDADELDDDVVAGFGLSASINSEESVFGLHLPGSSIKGYLTAGRNVRVDVDLAKMNKTGFIVFASEDPDMTIAIRKGTNDNATLIGTLSDQRFGMYINRADAFKALHCKKDCVFSLFVSTTAKTPAQYQITYTFDDKPVLIKDGLQYRVPNMARSLFLYRPDPDEHLSFDVFTQTASLVAFSKIVDESTAFDTADLTNEISEIKFDMKSDIAPSVQLVYSKAELNNTDNRYILFLIEPKFNYAALPDESSVFFMKHEHMARIFVRTKTVKLESYQQITDTVAQGQVKYYLIQLTEPIDFSIATMNVVGSIQVLLERGADEYPTTERFWKRQATTTGDVMVVPKASFTEETWPDADSNSGYTFIVGVYGKTKASFSIVLLAEFSKLLRVEFQKIVDIKLDPTTYFYLDFYDDKAEFESMFYADGADVEVSILDYDRRQGQDLVSMISDESNYQRKTVFKSGDLPWTEVNKVGDLRKTHVVMRLLAVKRPATVSVVMFDPKKPIEAPANERFHFAMNGATQTTFRIRLHEQTEKVDLDVKLFFGKVKVSITDDPETWPKTLLLEDSDQKYTKYELTNAKKDIIVFQEIFVKVEAPKFSKFSCLVKPTNSYKRLVAGEPEIVYASPDADTTLYFEVTSKMTPNIQYLDLEINSVSYYSENPELLFMSYDEVGTASDLIVPMPVIEMEEKNLEDVRQSIYSLAVMQGYYLIKIPKNPNKAPVKVVIVVNKVHVMEENAFSRGVIPWDVSKVEEYSLFLSETGEFRLVMESCVPVLVRDLKFEPKVAGNEASVDGSLKQPYPYIFIDETNYATKRELRKISYPIIRGMITGAGRLSFGISTDINSFIDEFNVNRRGYVMMSEFRPATKSLILKDYVDIFRDRQTFESFFVYYDFVHSQSSLRLTIRQPTFKRQLLDDYPKLERARLRLKVYLFSEENFGARIEQCGLSALSGIKYKEKTITFEFDRTAILSANPQDIEVFYQEEELEDLGDKDFLNVLCYISARFFESEDEEWQVANDLKYTNVPYFFLTIKNKHISRATFKILFLAILALLMLLIWQVWMFVSRKRASAKTDIITIRPKDLDGSSMTINTHGSIDERSMFENAEGN